MDETMMNCFSKEEPSSDDLDSALSKATESVTLDELIALREQKIRL